MGFFSTPTFGDVKAYLAKEAIVLDVRSAAEYEQGHVAGSKHIVLNHLPDHVNELKELNKPIITCCRSGARSGSAETFLKGKGFDVINGGPWQNVAKYL